MAVLERRRALEGRSQYVLQSQEALDTINRGLAPWARVGRAVEAKSAQVAQQIASPPAVAEEVEEDNNIPHFGDEASTRATDSATNPSVSIGQGNPQLTLDGRLAKTSKAPRKKKGLVGTSPLTASLTKWRASSTG